MLSPSNLEQLYLRNARNHSFVVLFAVAIHHFLFITCLNDFLHPVCIFALFASSTENLSGKERGLVKWHDSHGAFIQRNINGCFFRFTYDETYKTL